MGRKVNKKSPLPRREWSYVAPVTLDGSSANDWALPERQRRPYLAEERARRALDMLAVQSSAPTLGYQINNYEHCLQAATMVLRDGLDEETVVVSLFHDLGFITNNETLGEFAATFLKPYVSEKKPLVGRKEHVFPDRPLCRQSGLRPRYPGTMARASSFRIYHPVGGPLRHHIHRSGLRERAPRNLRAYGSSGLFKSGEGIESTRLTSAPRPGTPYPAKTRAAVR